MTSVHLLNQPVVLDLGSGLTKAGYAGTSEPSVVVGTLAGRARLPKVLPTSSTAAAIASNPTYHASGNMISMDGPSPSSLLRKTGQPSPYIVGDALHTLSGVLSLHHPLERGVVTDWAAAERLWNHVVHDALAVAPGEHPYLVTEAVLNAHANREKLAQFFFETLSAPSLHVAIPAVLALFASGRTTGLVLDAGDTVCTALPVAHGHCDVNAVRRLDLGGRDVTDRLLTLLRKSGASLFATSSERQAVRRMKERLAYVAVDPSKEELLHSSNSPVSAGSATKSFNLPDGNSVRINVERFRAPEILFQPHIVGLECGGVADAMTSAIAGVDIGLRRNLYSSIVLAVRLCCCFIIIFWDYCTPTNFTIYLLFFVFVFMCEKGGSTKFQGFPQRLLNELRNVAPSETKIRVHAPPDRLFSAFTGGTILASLSTTFRAMAITRAEYYEYGVSIVHRKTL